MVFADGNDQKVQFILLTSEIASKTTKAKKEDLEEVFQRVFKEALGIRSD